MNNLLPCIWCKSKEIEIVLTEEGHAVRCNDCGAYGPWANTKKNATKTWNSRLETEVRNYESLKH